MRRVRGMVHYAKTVPAFHMEATGTMAVATVTMICQMTALRIVLASGEALVARRLWSL